MQPRHSRCFSVALLAFLFTTGGCSSPSVDEDAWPILRELPVNHSETDEAPVIIVANSADDLEGSNVQHLASVVDFASESLIFIYNGPRMTTGYGLRIASVQQDGLDFAVHVHLFSPRGGAMVGAAITYPQAACVVPRFPAGANVRLVFHDR